MVWMISLEIGADARRQKHLRLFTPLYIGNTASYGATAHTAFRHPDTPQGS